MLHAVAWIPGRNDVLLTVFALSSILYLINYLNEEQQLLSPSAIDLLTKLLEINPLKRITADQALSHSFFYTDPLPLKPEEVPRYNISCHEWQTKKRKRLTK